jgi:hypothetical protein
VAGYDRGSGPYLYGRPLTAERLHQKILNRSWPQRDADGFHARDVHPAKHADDTPWRIDVDVRLEFEHDGQVVLAGVAERWNATHVFVAGINDPRVPPPGVWVLAADVRRR